MRICISINASSQVARSAVGSGRPVRPPCARIRFWRAASRDRLRRRPTPTRHRRGAAARTACGGRAADPGGPGADDAVAAESVQCRPDHSPVRAVDVRRATPQASRRGGWRRSVHKCAPARCWGSSPEVATRLPDTPDRFTSMLERPGRLAARRRARPAPNTRADLRHRCQPGSMPTVPASA
jgi:hypothetical protein